MCRSSGRSCPFECLWRRTQWHVRCLVRQIGLQLVLIWCLVLGYISSFSIIGHGVGSQSLPVLIIDNAIHHPEPHVSKVARSLYYGAQLYETEDDLGVMGVDGTLFLRAATAMLDGLGWVSRGEEKRGWDHSGLGWDEAWADSKGYVAVSIN